MSLFFVVLGTLLLLFPTPAPARWVNDRVNLSHESTGPVEFSHFRHLEKLGKDCPTCHNSIFNIVPEKNPRVPMKEMGQGQACGACHDGGRAFSIKGDCHRCHPTKDALYGLPEAGDVVFSHDKHTAPFGCADCHPRLFQPQSDNKALTMEEMEKGLGCGACHNGDKAFSVKEQCQSCHKGS